MQQRRLRLGDILDDYCPRERRVTNHVVVAMIEDDVRQTRCSTCDAEHEYKQAKAPAPRRKKAGALSQELLDDARPRAAVAAAPPSQDDLRSDDGAEEFEPATEAQVQSDSPPPAVIAASGDADSTEPASTDDER